MDNLTPEQFGQMVQEAAVALGEASSSLSSRIHPAALTEGFLLAAGFHCASTGRYFEVADEETQKRAVLVVNQGLKSGFEANDKTNETN